MNTADQTKRVPKNRGGHNRARKVTVSYEPLHGNLVLSVVPSEATRLRRLGLGHPETYIAEAAFIRRYLAPQGFVQAKPEDVGALTIGALIQNEKGEIFWNERYQVESFVEELIAGRSVEWRKG